MQRANAIGWGALGLVSALALACDSKDERGANDGVGGMGGGETPPGAVAGSGESTVPATGRTPGGDTSDLGTAGRGCGGAITGFEAVSLEEARARGFDPDLLLANVPGAIEANVQWDRPFSEPRTRVRVEFASNGSASIAGWRCGAGFVSCYAGNILLLNVGVSIETDDGRLQGRFVTQIAADNSSGSWVRSERGGDVYIRASHTGSSPFVGTLSLGDVDPASHPRVALTVLTTSSGELRAQVDVILWTDGGIDNPSFAAMPLDGCNVSAAHRSEPASPTCAEARFGSGSCCGGYLTRFPLPGEPSYPVTIGTDLACLAPDPVEDAGLGEQDQEFDAGTDPG
jgi:hypothetical protein